MSNLTRDKLKTLCQEREGVCVSINMPTHPRATEIDQGRIQLTMMNGRTVYVAKSEKMPN